MYVCAYFTQKLFNSAKVKLLADVLCMFYIGYRGSAYIIRGGLSNDNKTATSRRKTGCPGAKPYQNDAKKFSVVKISTVVYTYLL